MWYIILLYKIICIFLYITFINLLNIADVKVPLLQDFQNKIERSRLRYAIRKAKDIMMIHFLTGLSNI